MDTAAPDAPNAHVDSENDPTTENALADGLSAGRAAGPVKGAGALQDDGKRSKNAPTPEGTTVQPSNAKSIDTVSASASGSYNLDALLSDTSGSLSAFGSSSSSFPPSSASNAGAQGGEVAGGDKADLSAIPLQTRLDSSKWQHRVHAYKEIATILSRAGDDGDAEAFLTHGSSVVKAVKKEKIARVAGEAMSLLATFLTAAPKASADLVHNNALEGLAVEDLCKLVVKQTFAQNKLCLDKAFEAIFCLLEASSEASEAVVNVLASHFGDKKWKVALAAASCLREGFTKFGAGKGLPFAPVIAALPKLFAQKQGMVREEGTKVIVEIFSWMKTTSIFALDQYKKSLRESIEEACQKKGSQGTPVPSRFTPKTMKDKSKYEAAAAIKKKETSSSGASGIASSTSGGALPAVLGGDDELWAQLPATRFSDTLAKTSFFTAIKEKKWATRWNGWKSACEAAGPEGIFRLEKEDFSDIFRHIKKCLLTDSNVKVRVAAATLASKLAAGARADFSRYAKMLAPVVLSLYKEKKALHKLAMDACMDSFLAFCFPNGDGLKEIWENCISTGSLKDNNPLVRACSIELVQRFVSSRPVGQRVLDVDLSLCSEVVAAVIPMVHGDGESNPIVRKAACSLLMTLAQDPSAMGGIGANHASLHGPLDILSRKHPSIYSKIVPGQESSDISSTTGTSSTSRVNRTGTHSENKSSASVKGNKVGVSKPADSSKAASESRAMRSSARGRKSSIDDTTSEELPELDRAKEMVATLGLEATKSSDPPVEMPIVELIFESAWKDKKAAIDTVTQKFVAAQNPDSPDAEFTTSMLEAWIVVMGQATKQFADRNRNIMKSVLHNIQGIAKACGHSVAFPSRTMSLFIAPLAAKFSEKPLLADLEEMCLLVAECVGPSRVSLRLIEAIEKMKSPVALELAFKFLSRMISEFCSGNNVKRMFNVAKLIALSKHGKVGLGHRSPKVKDAAGALILVVCENSRDPGGMNSVRPLLEEGPESIADSRLKAIVEKMEKLAQTNAPLSDSAKTRSVKSVSGPSRSNNPKSKGLASSSSEATIDENDLIDLTEKLPASMLKKMATSEGKKAWKERVEALQSCRAVFEGAYGFGVAALNHAVVNVLRQLKVRLKDANANVMLNAVALIGLIAQKVGTPIHKCSKVMVQAIIPGLGSNKTRERDKYLKTLEEWVMHPSPGTGGAKRTSRECIDSCLPFLAVSLGGLKSDDGKECLLRWMSRHLSASTLGDATVDHFDKLLIPTMKSLESRSVSTRTTGKAVLAILAKRVGEESVRNALGTFKGASGRTITPIVNEVLLSVVSSGGKIIGVDGQAMSRSTGTSEKKQASGTRKSVPKGGSLARKKRKEPQHKPKPSHTSRKELSESEDVGLFSFPSRANEKERRARHDARKSKWVRPDDPDSNLTHEKDAVAQLKEQMRGILSDEMFQLMWPTSKNDRHNAKSKVQACGRIVDEVCRGTFNKKKKIQQEAMYESLDLLFKWCTLHFQISNTQVTKSVLSLLEEVLSLLGNSNDGTFVERANSSMSSLISAYEFGVIYPFCMMQCGDKKMKMSVQKIMKQLTELYLFGEDPSDSNTVKKVVAMLLHGADPHIMKSKDALTGCTLEIARLIESDPQGWKILGSTKNVRVLAQNLDSKAKDLRNATLAALVAAWKTSGKSQTDFIDKIVVGGGKSLSKVSSKGIDMLRNRFAAIGTSSADSLPLSSNSSVDRVVASSSHGRALAGRGAVRLSKGGSVTTSSSSIPRRKASAKSADTLTRISSMRSSLSPPTSPTGVLSDLPTIDVSAFSSSAQSSSTSVSTRPNNEAMRNALDVDQVLEDEKQRAVEVASRVPNANALSVSLAEGDDEDDNQGFVDVKAQVETATTVEAKVVIILSWIDAWVDGECNIHMATPKFAGLTSPGFAAQAAYEGGIDSKGKTAATEAREFNCKEALKALLVSLVAPTGQYELASASLRKELAALWEPIVISVSRVLVALYRGVRIQALTSSSGFEMACPALSKPSDKSMRFSFVRNAASCLLGTGIHAELGDALSSEGLEHLFHAAIVVLVSKDCKSGVEGAEEISKAFNELALRTIYKAKRVPNIVALVNLLTRSCSDPSAGNSQIEEESSLGPSSLDDNACVVVCRIIEKSLKREQHKPESGGKPFCGLDLAPLLAACNAFYASVDVRSLETVITSSPSKAEFSATPADTLVRTAPIRAIKGVLKAVARNLGKEDMSQLLTTVPSDSAVFKLLNRYIGEHRGQDATVMAKTKEDVKVPAATTALATPLDETAPPPPETKIEAPPAPLTIAEQLKGIFDKIQEGKGIVELYKFQQEHPDEPIDHLFADMSSVFRDHIKSQLEEYGKENGRDGAAPAEPDTRPAEPSASSSSSTSSSSSRSSMSRLEAIRARFGLSTTATKTSVPASQQGEQGSAASESPAGAAPAAKESSSAASMDLDALRARLAAMRT